MSKVNKFGFTDTLATQRIISGGITLGQVNNTYLRLDGTNSAAADINLNSHKLINVLDPKNSQEAATKNYVDVQVGSKLNTAGGILSGFLSMNGNKIISLGDPTENQEAATKNYVDTQSNLKLSITGGTLTGDLNMGAKKILALGEPTGASDAVTKNYVDIKSSRDLYTGSVTLVNNGSYNISLAPTGSTRLSTHITRFRDNNGLAYLSGGVYKVTVMGKRSAAVPCVVSIFTIGAENKVYREIYLTDEIYSTGFDMCAVVTIPANEQHALSLTARRTTVSTVEVGLTIDVTLIMERI